MKRMLLVAASLMAVLFVACGSSEGGDDASTSVGAGGTDTTLDASTGAVDVGMFFDGALDGDAVTVDCTLSGETEATCLEITVAGYPADTDIGPFCPRTTSDTADLAGIWFDGDAIYDIDGQFILDLPEIYDDDNWHLHDDEGNVFYTDTQEGFEAAARPDVDPAYQNHCIEGRIEWLDGGEPIHSTVTIPITPVIAGSPQPVAGLVGVTLNGVRIDGQAPVDAILGAYTIAAFDDCGGHINPFEGYHIHGATGCSEYGEASGDETPVFAYALDGYPIHSPVSADLESTLSLDACNGHTTDELGYHYHANQPEDNGVLTCFVGQIAPSDQGAGGGQNGPPPGG